MSCAAFTVETGIADLLIGQANGNLTAIGVEAPTGRRLEANVASIHRRLSEEGDCPCADGWVKYKGEWVQPTDEEAAEAGYVRSDEVGACGCITWVKQEGERRRLFEGACEDAADDAVAALTAELDLPYANCAELRAAGECDRAIVKKHCPATCDACADNAELGLCEDAADEIVKQLSEEALGRPVSSCTEVTALGACRHELAKKHCPASCGLCDPLGEPEDRMNHRGLKRTCR